MINLFVFVFGAIIGSFLNVVICRYNTGSSIIKGNSKCFNCNKKLKWHELIPVISFIIQKGKCKECGSRISWQYPLVETATGLLFLLVVGQHLSIFNTVYFWIIFSILIVIAVYDLRHQIIPDLFVYSFIGFSLIFILISSPIEWKNIIAGISFFAFFAFFWLVSKGAWMGFGDAKFAFGIGLFLGLYKGIVALLFSFWIGGIIGISLLILNKKGPKSKIAFGPFLVLGTIIAFFCGEYIIKLYLSI